MAGSGCRGSAQTNSPRHVRNKSAAAVSAFPAHAGFAIITPRQPINQAPGRLVMAKGQMRSNKEKKKPKQDKNRKKGGAAPSPFASGKSQPSPYPGKKG